MASFKIPPHSDGDYEIINSPEDKEKKQERKIPEFVYLENDSQDETQHLGSTPQDPRQMFGSIETMTKGRHPFYLRILSLFGSCIMLVLALITFVIFFIAFCFSLLFVRQSTYMNDKAANTWNWFKKFLVFTLGCFVSTFNFSLGVGLVLMYFMLRGEKVHNRFFEEFTRYQKKE